MATLDDKLLGEKLHYYCSSSEDEGEEPSAKPAPESYKVSNQTVNTGPKGVVKDFMRFKQLESQQREEQTKEKLELAKKLSMTCRTTTEDDKCREEDAELQALLDDDFMKMYIDRRMREMELVNTEKIFGNMSDLDDGEEFLRAIDGEDSSVTVIVYIYEDDAEGCYAMNECLKILAEEYINVKFARISASAIGSSNLFKNRGVPAILAYKSGELLQSFPGMTADLGLDFYATDVENFLIKNDILHK